MIRTPPQIPMIHRAAGLLTTVPTLEQITKYMKSNDSMHSIGQLYRGSSLIAACALPRAVRTAEREALAGVSRVVAFQLDAREKQLLPGQNAHAPMTAAPANQTRALRP